jgi:hypothetical protein
MVMDKFKLKAKELLTTTRFDLIVKYLYAKSYKSGLETDYFLKMYKQHLKIWNNFKEYDNPKKNSFEAFKTIFEELIDDITVNGFDGEKSTIPVVGKNVLNGAHRVATSLINNNEVTCINGTDGRDGQLNCGWPMFERMGFRPEYADRVALEYAKLKTNTHIVTLFPTATSKGRIKEVESILNQHTKVFYSKRIPLSRLGLFNLMREFYHGEDWAGGHPHYGGFRAKTKGCYQGEGDTIVYLCEFSNLPDTVKVKELIRKLYNAGKHSVHINDTHEETVRISKSVFNDNSVHFLNNNKSVGLLPNFSTVDQKYFQKFETCLNQYKSYLSNDGFDMDDYCISASSTLSIYGLREGNDIDYIHHDKRKIEGNSLISSHNDYGTKLYPYGYDEIIYNPNLHFYTRGIKFASLDVVKKLKENRGEPKDKVDIDLINSII